MKPGEVEPYSQTDVSFGEKGPAQSPHDVVQQERLELGAKGLEAGVLVEPQVGQSDQSLEQTMLAFQRPLVELRHLLR